MPLPSRNSALDRQIDFVPNRVLKAPELEWLQSIEDNSDVAGVGLSVPERRNAELQTG